MKIAPLYIMRDITNLKDMIEQSEKHFGSKNAFWIKAQDDNYNGITYNQFKKDIDALGTALIDLGLKDKFIAVLGENRYEWCLSYLSVVNGTGIVIPIDKELPAGEIESLLSRCDASAIIYSGKYAETIKKISDKIPNVQYFINMDSNEHLDRFLSFKQLINRGRILIDSGDKSFTEVEIDEKKLSILLFTSGTTAMSKGVMLNHNNICSNIISVCSTVYIDNNDISLSILPLHHTYECTLGFLLLMYRGGTVSFNEGLKHISRDLKAVKPTVLISVPLLLENMHKKIWEQAGKEKGLKTKLKIAIVLNRILNNVFKIDLSSRLFKQIHQNIGGRLRLVITGAAAIDPEVAKGFRDIGIPVLQGYGLTECSPLVTGNRDKYYNPRSIGIPIPGVEIALDRVNELGIGEIKVKGPNVMLGYFKNEEATKSVFKDGWFLTGDLAKQDRRGFCYITGRNKNVIVTKNGKNIYPEELEFYINKSPFVVESLVWGKLDKSSGETQVAAQIFPNLEAIKEKLKVPNVTKEDILKLFNDVVKSINKNVPLYKHIRDFSIRDTEFVKTTTKKIKRYVEESI